MVKQAFRLEDGLKVGNIFDVDVSTNETTAKQLKLTSIDELIQITDANQPFQIGELSEKNISMDTTRIQARDNGVASPLFINPHGGRIEFLGENNITIRGDGEIVNTGIFKYLHEGSVDPTFNNDLFVLGELNVTGNIIAPGIITQAGDFTNFPVFTLGENTTDDNKDRGIAFKYNDGVARTGFFGYADLDQKFYYLIDTTNTGDVITGTAGTIVADFEGTFPVITGPVDVTGQFTVSGAQTILTQNGNIPLIVDSDTLSTVFIELRSSTSTDNSVKIGATGNKMIFRTNNILALTIDETQNALFQNDVTVTNDLTVSGTVDFTDSNNVNIGDSILTLNADFTGPTPTENGGLEIERGDLTNATLQWNETTDQWEAEGNRILVAGGNVDTTYSDTTFFSTLLSNDPRGLKVENDISDTVNTFADIMLRVGASDGHISLVNTGPNLSEMVFSVDNGGSVPAQPLTLKPASVDVEFDLNVGGRTNLTNNLNAALSVVQNATSMSNATYTVDIDSSLHDSNLTAAGAFRVSTFFETFIINGQGNLFTSGTINVTDTTSSTSTITGSGIFGGGVGIAENLNVGGKVIVGGVTGNTLFANDKFIQVGSTITGDRFGYELSENDGVNNHRASYYLDSATGEVTWDATRSAGTASKYIWKLLGVQKMQLTAAGALTLMGGLVATTGTLSGILSVDDTTDSNSITTGSGQFAGGLGVALKSFFGETLTITKSAIASSEQLGLSVAQAADPTRGFKILSNSGSGTFSIGGGLDMVIANNRAAGDIYFATDLATTPTQILRLIGSTLGATFAGDISIPALSKLFLDGGTDTYIHERTANTIALVTGGVNRFEVDSAGNAIFTGNATLTDGFVSITNLTASQAGLFVKSDFIELIESAAGRSLQIHPAKSGANHIFTSTNTGAGFDFENNVGRLGTLTSNGLTIDGTGTFNSTVETTTTKGGYFQVRATSVGSAFTPDESVGAYRVWSNDTSGVGSSIAGIMDVVYEEASGTDYAMVFSSRNGTGLVERMRFSGAGNLATFTGDAVFAKTVSAFSDTFAVATPSSYGVQVDSDLTLASDGTKAYIQSWNLKPLHINSLGNDIVFGGEISVPTIRVTGVGDASLTSTTHGFQVGTTTSGNIIIDGNEIIARNNGATSPLFLQADGGNVTTGNNSAANRVIIGTGKVKTQLGTAAAPAYTYELDTDTGTYSPSSNTWAVTTGGVQRISVNSVGVVFTVPIINTQATAQSSAVVVVRRGGESIEFGHGNTAGFASTIGAFASNGHPWIAFAAMTGTTANTMKTTGLVGSMIEGWAGDVLLKSIQTASADNQVPITNFTSHNNGDATVRGDVFATGTKYEGDAKEIIRFSDAWLRINPANEFTSGIFLGSGITRTDGNFQVGSGGATFNVTGSTFKYLTNDIFHAGNVDAVQTINGELSGRATTVPDSVADGNGFSVDYFNSAAVNGPPGTDHAGFTMAFSSIWQVQQAGDWRTNKWYVRTQEAGVWKPWAEVITSLGGTISGDLIVGSSLDRTPTNGEVGQLIVRGAGYSGWLALDATNMYVGHNSSVRNLVLQTNETNRLTINGSTGDVTLANKLTVNGNNIAMLAVDSRAKYQVWNTSAFAIGMGNSYTYGNLNGFAMTFQMNNNNVRGFWWGDEAHTNAQGAMSLTTDGRLVVDQSIEIGLRGEKTGRSRGLVFEVISDTLGEASSRIMFTENNNTVVADNNEFGFSIQYDGIGTASTFPITGSANLGANAKFAIRRHDNSLNGVDWIWGQRNIANVNVNRLQTTGLATSWGVTSGINTGGVNVVQGTTSAATWLISGTSAGVFRGGIQLLDSGGFTRYYTSGAYFSFSSTGIVHNPNNVASTSNSTGSFNTVGGIGCAGAINAGGNITAFATSDIRAKYDIKPITGAVSKVQKLSGNSFYYNEPEVDADQGKQYGLIAQEVQKVLPEMVIEKEDGNLALRQAGFEIQALLVEAIKEQQNEIDELKNMVKALLEAK